MIHFATLAVVAGGAVAIQAGMNAQLGSLLGNALLASGVAFAASVLLTVLALGLLGVTWPSVEQLRSVPPHLWFSGVLSAFGVSMFYYLIPRMGVGSMMSFALSAQLVVALVAGHFGWFDLPARPFTPARIAGLGALVAGVVLVNQE